MSIKGTLDLTGFFPEEFAEVLTAQGWPAFRAKQLFRWLHHRLVTSFAEMSDLPAEMRRCLETTYTLTTLAVDSRAEAPDGTVKYLFRLPDGQTIETVYMPEAGRATVCVSTQVGCAYGCTFCATGLQGFVRNLTAAEIVEQVYRIQATIPPEVRVTNVVYMGMGEPLANYEPVLRSVRLLIHPLGLNLAQRRITLSTVGLVPGMERLADEGLQVNLAVSLHAATQEDRLRLLPIARKYPLPSVMAAARQYVHHSRRKITFEYTVVPGMNDRESDAVALAGLVRHLQSVVNVIPLHPNEGLMPGITLSPSELQARAARFTALLSRHGVEAVLRRSRGREVMAACGQLRGRASTRRKPG